MDKDTLLKKYKNMKQYKDLSDEELSQLIDKKLQEEELLTAFDRIVDDVNMHEKLVRKGLDRSRMFSWHETAVKTYTVYRDVL